MMKFLAARKIPSDIDRMPICVIDLGFSESDRSVGIATHNFMPEQDGRCFTFGEAISLLRAALETLQSETCFIVLEAPLSMARTNEGGPCHRHLELQRSYENGQAPRSPKGWYYQAGANLSLAASIFLRDLGNHPAKAVHLAEAFYCSYQRGETHPAHCLAARELLETLLRSTTSLVKPEPESAGGRIELLPGLEDLVDDIPHVLLREQLQLRNS